MNELKPIANRKSSIQGLISFVQNGQLPAGIIPLQKDFREVIVSISLFCTL